MVLTLTSQAVRSSPWSSNSLLGGFVFLLPVFGSITFPPLGSLVDNSHFNHLWMLYSTSSLGVLAIKIKQLFGNSIDYGERLNSLFVEIFFHPQLLSLDKVADLS